VSSIDAAPVETSSTPAIVSKVPFTDMNSIQPASNLNATYSKCINKLSCSVPCNPKPLWLYVSTPKVSHKTLHSQRLSYIYVTNKGWMIGWLVGWLIHLGVSGAPLWLPGVLFSAPLYGVILLILAFLDINFTRTCQFLCSAPDWHLSFYCFQRIIAIFY